MHLRPVRITPGAVGIALLVTLIVLAAAPAGAAAAQRPSPDPGNVVTTSGDDRACPQRHAGVCYDPRLDTSGGLAFYRRWTENNLARWRGIPRADAERIALAHTKAAWLRRGERPETTGFAMDNVNQFDEHAAIGDDGREYDSDMQQWGVTFLPRWGRTAPPRLPDGRLAGVAAGPDNPSGPQRVAAGGVYGVGGGFALGELVRGIDWEELLARQIQALWAAIFREFLESMGREIAAFVLVQPNLLAENGSMGRVQGLVDDLRLGALGLCLVLFSFTATQVLLGYATAPQEALGRLLAAIVALGCYRDLVGWVVGAARALTAGITTLPDGEPTGVMDRALLALGGTAVTLPGWAVLLAIAGSLLVIVLGLAKIVGFAFLLLAYAAGPLLIPLAIWPRTAGLTAQWAEHLVKVLLWPAVWALELRVFAALFDGVSYVDARGQVTAQSIHQGNFQLLLTLALLVVMAATPWVVQTRFTLGQAVRVAVRRTVHIVEVGAAAASGGASLRWTQTARRVLS